MTDEELTRFYEEGFFSGDVVGFRAGLRAVYNAGMAAALADLPDRETIAKTLYRANWGDLHTWEDDKDHWLKQADAVLALLRGERDK